MHLCAMSRHGPDPLASRGSAGTRRYKGAQLRRCGRASGSYGPPPQGTTPPKLFGQDFNITDATGFFGTPTFLWTLHVWIWKPNPAGIFESWNTRVTCD